MNRYFLYTSCILLVVVSLSVITLFNGCQTKPRTVGYQLTGDTITDGKNLVQLNCTKCHALVSVNALTKDVWLVHTLPAMAHYLSISTYGTDFYKNEGDTTGMSLTNWQIIAAYYKKLAPDTLATIKPTDTLINDWAGFTVKKAAKVNDICFTSLVAAQPGTNNIYTADAVSGNLTEWDNQLKAKRNIQLPSPAVDANFIKDSSGVSSAVISCIGRLDPIDFPNGRIFSLDLKKQNAEPKLLDSDLPRPMQTIAADFDKDGTNEYVICGAGGLKGGVYLLKKDAKEDTYKQTTIANRAGAVQAVTGDFNKDGWPDIMVLFGSSNEGLTLFLNNQKGGFTSKDLLNFPPVYGSTSFQLADIDHDGDLDLIYTCGYNFRDSRILKPYHGLYIYKNNGDFKFEKEWFYPINGCTKAIAADFDNDGDLDIATIAFFADMKNKPAEEFIYFEQDKAMHFKPHAVPVSQYGRWMAMEVTDHNHDGKPDIILGNYASGFLFQPNFTPAWDEHTPFIVLENNMMKK
ncbi:FG-GAP repeat domain-containing protein [Mucilaginibacter segetis]|uniref:VCBS repeat-containing protein n=1 Tax=Mucilaginibacter segetis TaxID=2793071 RepID=A0A934PT03_9SPHI|nr:VCBS repeat-containing protein [Mucilaginibacter segetis]MBK0378641.1 VCBS repeat-containing protein [Mucilaginibacter segetis]